MIFADIARFAVACHARVIRREQLGRFQHPFLNFAGFRFVSEDAASKTTERARGRFIGVGERAPETTSSVIPSRCIEEEHGAGKPLGIAV